MGSSILCANDLSDGVRVLITIMRDQRLYAESNLRFFFFQFKRCKVMRRERQRQHRMGEREIKYAMPPKPGNLQL